MDVAVDPKIAEAVRTVRKTIKKLVHDEQNQHGGYSYVSIDTYYQQVIPVASEAGLVWRTRETTWELVEGMGRTKDRTYVKARFAFDLFCAGATALDYMHATVMSPLEGAQTTGQLFSYADKVLMRSAFGIATGERDADANATEPTRSLPTGLPSSSKRVERFEDKDVPEGVDPITGEILEDQPAGIENGAAMVSVLSDMEKVAQVSGSSSKEGDPVIDTRKINDQNALMIVDIFRKWMPTVKTSGRLLDWHAENVAAIETVGKINPEYKEAIKAMFREKNMALKPQEKPQEKQ